MTLMALGVIPVDHPLSLGMLGMHGAPYANHLLEECDLLIVAGARFDDRATGDLTRFCPNARVVHIDVDGAELNKLRSAQIGIIGDVKPVLEALCVRTSQRSRKRWLGRVAELRRRHPMRLPGIDCPRSHYGLIACVHGCLDDSAIITTDVGQHQMWVAQSYPLRRPRQWLTSGGLGTMGFGLPVAIGAALEEPTRTVVCFSGDGSILMNVQELTTLAETNVNVKVVVMDNRALGLVRQQQTLFYEGRIFESRFKRVPDFVSVAKAFGVPAIDLDSCVDPLQALRHALQEPGPCLIHASIDENENVFPMVPPGAANTEMIGA
jgi:acetolactate synthase-1/2/3 large subunit